MHNDNAAFFHDNSAGAMQCNTIQYNVLRPTAAYTEPIMCFVQESDSLISQQLIVRRWITLIKKSNFGRNIPGLAGLSGPTAKSVFNSNIDKAVP